MAQQLIVPHEFQFASATILDRGDDGLIWNVTDELFPKEGWTCSVLQLPAMPAAKDTVLTAEEIRRRATQSLSKRSGADDVSAAPNVRMPYVNQERIRIPVATHATGELIYAEIWAVNFRDPARKERPEERLTVWVTEDGRTAGILHLDF